MVDSPTTRNRLRKQELGTNINSWGDTKLNEAFDVVDQAMDGYLAIALTGDVTLTTTNYTTADQAKRRVLKFTGALAAAASVTVPSVEHEYAIINAAGATVTVKTFAGAGIDIPTGYQARVYCDAVDVFNGSPTLLPGDVRVSGKVKNLTAGAADTDAVNKIQMETAISVLAGVLAGGLVLSSSTDLAAKYLQAAITAAATSGIVLTPTSVGTINEFIAAALNVSGMTALTANSAAGDDYIPGYDTSAAAHKKFAIQDVVRRHTATQRFFATA